MSEQSAKELITQGDFLFGKKSSLNSLWQEIADNFYVERADFTVVRPIGNEFAAHLTTSYPMLARRDLGNTFSSMLRPTGKQWFNVRMVNENDETNEVKRFLEAASIHMRNMMYSRVTQFVRATKEADHDFAAFGQAVISIERNFITGNLLYRCWHLRDCAWCEDEAGMVDTMHRKWKPTAREMNNIFRGNVAPQVKKQLEKDPYQTFECRHVVVPSDQYKGDKKWKTPFVSIHIDVANNYVMEEMGAWSFGYIVPRWQTVSGSQYAYSPATVAALPDARLIQAMTLTLLEAGEKATNPPLVAVQEAIRSDIAVYAGGITWVDSEYDERLGEVLRPMTIDKTGIPTGFNMQQEIRGLINEAFFLNKLNLPPQNVEMTAYETSQRMQEYIRNALPLFEPMELDYNAAMCEMSFDMYMRSGAFGSPRDLPQELQGQDIHFRFESPLSDAMGKEKGQKLIEAKAALAQLADIDPSVLQMIDTRTTIRDVLSGISTPTKWIKSEEEMKYIDMQNQEKQHAAEALQLMNQGGMAAEQIGKAGQAIQQVQGGAASQAGL